MDSTRSRILFPYTGMENRMIVGKLSPEGASLLRRVRDHIRVYPEQLFLGTWECNTTACIAGHCHRFLVGTRVANEYGIPTYTALWGKNGLDNVVKGLGFTVTEYSMSDPPSTAEYDLDILFLTLWDENLDEVESAAQRIDAFLWKYGYPPDEVQGSVETRQAQAEV